MRFKAKNYLCGRSLSVRLCGTCTIHLHNNCNITVAHYDFRYEAFKYPSTWHFCFQEVTVFYIFINPNILGLIFLFVKLRLFFSIFILIHVLHPALFRIPATVAICLCICLSVNGRVKSLHTPRTFIKTTVIVVTTPVLSVSQMFLLVSQITQLSDCASSEYAASVGRAFESLHFSFLCVI